MLFYCPHPYLYFIFIFFFFLFFFFNDTATTEIYTLSHTTLFRPRRGPGRQSRRRPRPHGGTARRARGSRPRSEEHTSELQSRLHLVCRLLLEKKKTNTHISISNKTNTKIQK